MIKGHREESVMARDRPVAPRLRYAIVLGIGALATRTALDLKASGAGLPGGLIWKSERVEAGDGPARKKVDALKAWLTVPQDWAAPDGPTFRLQVLRLKATTVQPGLPRADIDRGEPPRGHRALPASLGLGES